MNSRVEIRPGRRIHVSIYQREASKPTLFLIHGLGGRGYQWREQISYFQNKYTLIVPDLLGQGESEKPVSSIPNPYSFTELSEDMQALFERFAGNTNFVVGHSYGGALSTLLAMRNQSRIQKLALISPVGCRPFKGVPLVYLLPVCVLEWMRPTLDKSFEKMAFAPQDEASLLNTEREARAKNPMAVIKALLAGMRHIPVVDITGLTTPTLIICGQLDRVIPVSSVEDFYNRLPHQHWLVLENASHMVHLERSPEVNAALEQFFSS